MQSLLGSRAKVAVWAVALVLVSACRERKEFPVEPRIEFISAEVFNDSLSLTISFTDGDGDVGLDNADSAPPFDSGSQWHNNLFVEYYQQVNGEWTSPPLLLPLHYRIPRLTPEGRNKALEGELSVGLAWPVFPMPPGSPTDTVKFSLQLVDRALHLSNVVYTEPMLVTH